MKADDAEEKNKTLFRYTNLASLFYVLRNRRLTTLNYLLWDDRNDQYYMGHYKQRGHFESVLAACFTMGSETYHHWRVFAPGADGVRIHFSSGRLLPALRTYEGIRFGSVAYKKIDEMRMADVALDQLPFLKRIPYRDEKEFRVLWSSRTQKVESKDFDIPLDSITRITLSPWLPPDLAESLKATIKGIEGCSGIRVYPSTLRDNKRWQDFVSKIGG